MEKPKTSVSKDLPWIWIIETLADCRQVQPNVFDELLSKVSDSSQGFWARERLALRQLEDLFGAPQANVVASIPSTSTYKPQFDVSERAQDVYRLVLDEMTTSRSRICALESLKLDVHQFIFQKRACLPKCAVEQVKEAILEDRYSPLRKRSGLESLGIEHKKENRCRVKTGAPRPAIESRDQNTTLVVSQTLRVNLAQAISENAENPLPENLLANIVSSTCNEMPNKKQVQSLDGNGISFGEARDCEHKIDCDTHLINEVSVLENVNKNLQKDLPAVALTSSKIKNSDSTRGGRVDCADGDEQQTIVKKRKKCGQFRSMGQNGDTLVVTDLIEEPFGAPHIRNLDEETAGDADKSDQDSQTADWTESTLCIKCNRGGQLLICGASNCPSVVHENCLGSPASFDEMGNFYCPFCFFSQASAEYKDSKKRFSLAKAKAALARDQFLKFVGLVSMRHQKQTSAVLPTEILSQSRLGANVNSIVDSCRTRQLNEIFKSQLLDPRTHQQKAEVSAECSKALGMGAPSSFIHKRKDTGLTEGTPRNQVCNHQDSGLLENQLSLEPQFFRCTDDLPQIGETAVLSRTDVSFRNGRGEEKLGEQHQSIGTEARKKIACSQGDTSLSTGRGGQDSDGRHIVSKAREQSSWVQGDTEEVLKSQEIPNLGTKNAQMHTIGSQQRLLSPLNAGAENPVNSHCVDAETVLNSREQAYVGTDNAVLEEQNVDSPRRCSTPVNLNIEEIFSKFPYVDIDVSICKEHADVATEDVVLQKQTVNSPQARSSAANINPVEITGNPHADVGTADLVLQEQTVNPLQAPSSAMKVNSVEITDNPPLSDKETVLSNHKHAAKRSRKADKETVSSNQQHADKRSGKAILFERPANVPQTVSNVDDGEVSENEDDRSVFELKRRKLPTRFNEEIPSSTRRKHRWTTEEEEKLKEGFEKFAISGHKNVPWKKILEFGRYVFLDRRTAADLKDKWRREGWYKVK